MSQLLVKCEIFMKPMHSHIDIRIQYSISPSEHCPPSCTLHTPLPLLKSYAKSYHFNFSSSARDVTSHCPEQQQNVHLSQKPYELVGPFIIVSFSSPTIPPYIFQTNQMVENVIRDVRREEIVRPKKALSYLLHPLAFGEPSKYLRRREGFRFRRRRS